MKKTSTFKKLGIAAVAVPVCFAMAAPSLAATVGFAKAEDPAPATPTSATLFEGSIASTCDYGDTFTVPAVVSGATVEVTAPNGTVVATSDGKVTANQVGNYIVTYTNGGVSYDYRVYVSLAEDGFLKITDNGATIPTYLQNGGEITLPSANVNYFDENDILQSYDGFDPATDLVITTSKPIGEKTTFKAGDKITPTDNGKLFITYSAVVGGESGTKRFNKTFTVNVQSSFDDTEAPRISIAGVTESVSINRPVTLPKATATDNYDENILIKVTVTDPNGAPVKTVDIDRDGYAYRVDETDAETSKYKPVEFDNDEVMTFYPTEAGTYTVKYVATDDKGNTSGERVYSIVAGDHVAPVFKSIKDYMIPETWALDVKGAGGNTIDTDANPTLSSGKITFPIPELVDNKSRVGNKDDGIELYFRITDVEKSRTVVSFSNILSTAEDGTGTTFKADSYYGEDGETYTFSQEKPFTFDFDLYHRDADSDDMSGEYTVYYRATDKSGNRSTKSYTITVRDEYEDKDAPTRADVSAPAYIAVADKEFTVPVPEVSDALDSRPQVTYRIYTNNGEAKEEDTYIEVEGGEKAEFDGEYLYINKGKDDLNGSYEKKLKLGDKLCFYVKATDKVGNSKSNATDDSNILETCEATTMLIKTAATTLELDENSTIKTKVPALSDIKSGDKVNVGGFTVNTEADMRNYVGFEVVVRDGKDNPLNVTLETFSDVDGANAHIYVKNISFNAGAEGTHKVTVRIFDVNGTQKVYGYTFDVAKSTSNPGNTSAATIGTTGSVNVSYKLHNEKIENIGTSDKTYYVVRKITGSMFSLMGSEITAYAQGSYSVKDGYIDKTDIANYDNEDTVDAKYGYALVEPYGTPYSFSVTDTAAPVIEVQGTMPTYSEKYNKEDASTLITLPSVIAYSENGNAKVEVKVTGPKAQTIATTYNKEKNEYSFKGEYDGAYTVTYTATYADASPVTATYTINVGDVVGPLFSYDGGTKANSSLKVGSTFTFGKLEVTGESSTTGFTVTKKLMDPSRAEVTDATVSGSYSTYRNHENNGTEIKLDKVGEYRVVYTVTDASGNETVLDYKFTVVNSGSSSPATFTGLSIALTVVAVLLLAGVIVYVVRFRKVKSK